MKKWIAAALALLLVISIGTLRVDAAEKNTKKETTEKYPILDTAVVAPAVSYTHLRAHET